MNQSGNHEKGQPQGGKKGQPQGVAPTDASQEEIMKYNPDIHHRRSIRLKGYDYSRAGLYFITICAQDQLCLFGKIENGQMVLNDAGKMIQTVWNELPVFYIGFNIHGFVVMPNHVHGIIEIKQNPNTGAAVGAGPISA